MIAFDVETARIEPGRPVPPLACCSWSDGGEPELTDARQTTKIFSGLLGSTETLVGHNVAFDLSVLAREGAPLAEIFRALDDGRIGDTMLREQLLAIADGSFDSRRFGLAAVVSDRFGVEMDKGEVRTGFGQLIGRPLAAWPPEAIAYAKRDAYATARLWLDQEERRHDKRWTDFLFDEPAQVRAAWALRLTSCRGLRTDRTAVEALRKKLEEAKAGFDAKLRRAGVLRSDGTKDMAVLRQLVSRAYGGNPPLTAKESVATSAQVLLESGDEFLIDLAGGSEQDRDNPFRGSRAAKFLSTYVPSLELATRAPLCAGYLTLKTTGRTGCREPNVQNLPTTGGIRPCFVPRPGFLFVDADYSALELRTLSQSCLDLVGRSSMADAIRAGADLHCLLAGTIFGEDPADISARYAAGDARAENQRKLAKAGNFGLPGGMGAERFASWARTAYKLDLTVERARDLKRAFLERWDELPEYFSVVGEICDGETGDLRLPRSRRVHGRKFYTEACNLLFQGPAADGAKAALYEVTKRCFLARDSALFGSRPVAFVHDEILLEAVADRAEAARIELEEVMIEQMRLKACPDVPVAVSSAVMERWA